MKTWQVQLRGEGFLRNGHEASFELGGVVEASTVEEAFNVSVALARRKHPELEQAQRSHKGPGAVINAEEIEECSKASRHIVGSIEVHWSQGASA